LILIKKINNLKLYISILILTYMKEISIILISYLIGSISFAYIFGKLFKGIDIRKKGTKNAGASNVFLTVGKIAGILTLTGDFTKGAAAVLLAKYFLMPNYIIIIAGAAAIIGHIFPIFLKFKGGKGIATTIGMMIPLIPRELLFALGILIILSLLFKRLLLAQLIALGILPFLALYLHRSQTIIIGVFIIILVRFVIDINYFKKKLFSKDYYYKLMKRFKGN